MSRLLRVVLTLVVAWLGAGMVSVPALAAPTPEVVHTYTYDDHDHGAHLASGSSERGPPTCGHTTPIDHEAVKSEWFGVSPRLSRATPPVATTYNQLTLLVQVAGVATTTEEPARDTQAGLSSFASSRVATNTVPSGLPRDALGRFTSGAGGESAAAAAGRTAHANYANTLGGGNYVFNRALPGSRLRPDAVDYSQNIVRELKPGTPSGISRGWRQVNEYKAYLEELTGQPWTAYVDVYTP